MNKKLTFAIGEAFTLYIVYIVSSALEETVSMSIENALTGDFALDSMLKLVDFSFGLLATGPFDFALGLIVIGFTFWKVE